jgi:hypothetical protein
LKGTGVERDEVDVVYGCSREEIVAREEKPQIVPSILMAEAASSFEPTVNL